MTYLGLPDIDVDGALRESAAALPDRRGLLAGAATTLAGLLALLRPAGAVAAADGHGYGQGDVAILNFALALEYLQASFYTEAEGIGALHGSLARQAQVVGSHERAHVAAFRKVLGTAAIPRPRYDFHGTTGSAGPFRATAVALEDLAVGAYKEQLPRIRSDVYLATAVSIHSVEARHAAWIRQLAGYLPAERAFDDPISDQRTVQLVNSTHFVTLEDPRTSSARDPRFTG